MISKSYLVLGCLLVAVILSGECTHKYDNVNVKEILNNKRLLLAYVNCVLDKGKCSPEAKELKDNLQDSLETGCDKCTESEVKKSTEVLNHLIQHERDIWNQITAKYDPEGVWRKKHEDRAREMGITLPKE